MTRSPGIDAMKAETRPGRCIFCEQRLPQRIRKPRVMCRARECLLLYHRVYGIDRRSNRRNAQEASP